MSIKDQVKLVKESLKDYPDVEVVAATKYMDVDQTKKLVESGITKLGVNRVDMFKELYESLKDNPDLEWHFFGVLLPKMIKDIANRIQCLHSLDGIALAAELDKKLKEPLDCFVQVNITGEDNGAGVPINKVKNFVKQLEVYKKIKVVGLMCIEKLTFDEDILIKYFQQMQKLKEEVQSLNLPSAPCHKLSMGMSNDYKLAVKYGATTVRLGRIFLI